MRRTAGECGDLPGSLENRHDQGLLYVGDEERVQEIEPDGKWVREVSLRGASSGTGAAGGKVKALAVDSSGDLYLVYNNYYGEGGGGIRELTASGTLTKEIDPAGHVYTFALDSLGHIAAMERESGFSGITQGVVFDASTGERLGTFLVPVASNSTNGVAFSPAGYLYGVDHGAEDIERYAPLSVAFLTTGPDTGLTATTATLTGEVNPNEIPETTAWFQYGISEAFEASTPAQSFAADNQSFPLQAPASLIPNQKYYYRLVSEDAHQHTPAPPASGETLSLTTPVIAPQTLGQPAASFVTAQSAILNATVNPEHTATRYHFEYGACASLAECSTLQSTPEETSSVYGGIGSTHELTALAPSTTYSFRLVASNEFEEQGQKLGGQATSKEGSFTTGPAPTLTASTSVASAVTPTTAVLSGVVNPDGQPATYTFELGVYEGAATQYGIVTSAPTGASTTPVEEAFPLTSLQPGVTYAYRIAIHSGYGEATGATATFTSPGLPSVLSSPASPPLLATPSIAFPTETTGSTTTPKALTKTQKLAKALKLCKKDRSRAKKATCEKAAHRKYGAVRAKKKKK